MQTLEFSFHVPFLFGALHYEILHLGLPGLLDMCLHLWECPGLTPSLCFSLETLSRQSVGQSQTESCFTSLLHSPMSNVLRTIIA